MKQTDRDRQRKIKTQRLRQTERQNDRSTDIQRVRYTIREKRREGLGVEVGEAGGGGR